MSGNIELLQGKSAGPSSISRGAYLELSTAADSRAQTADAGLRCEVVTDFSRLERLAPEWEDLFTKAPPPGGLFQNWGWARAYWKAHQGELALCTPVVFSGDDVVGILPVAIRGQTAGLLGAGYADYNGLLCRPEYARDVCTMALTALLRAPLPWVECEFAGIPERSPLLQSDCFPETLRAHRQIVFHYFCPAASNGTGDVFYNLSRKQSLRRHEKRLGRLGRLSFRHVEDRQEILDRHLHEFFRMQVARRAMDGIESQFLRPSARAMTEALIREFDPAHELRFSVLELEGRPVAYHLGIQHAGTLTWYMPVFDLDYWDDGPGEVLLRNLLKYAHEQRLAEFDFTIGDEAYKSRFSNCVRRTFTLYFYRSPHSVAVETRRVLRAVRNGLRRSPLVISRVRELRDFLERVSARLQTFDFAALVPELRKRIYGQREFVVFSRTGLPPANTDTRVQRIGLSELVLLSPVSKVKNAANRDRIRNGAEPYVVSTNSSRRLYWVSRYTSQEGLPAFVISEAAMLPGKKPEDAAELVSALICHLNCPGNFRISVPAKANLDTIAQRCGCTIV